MSSQTFLRTTVYRTVSRVSPLFGAIPLINVYVPLNQQSYYLVLGSTNDFVPRYIPWKIPRGTQWYRCADADCK